MIFDPTCKLKLLTIRKLQRVKFDNTLLGLPHVLPVEEVVPDVFEVVEEGPHVGQLGHPLHQRHLTHKPVTSITALVKGFLSGGSIYRALQPRIMI